MGMRGDAIVQFDWSVGKIMETLDKLGIAENTIVLLTSDNGPVVDDGYQDQARSCSMVISLQVLGVVTNTVLSKVVRLFLLSFVGQCR